MSPARHRVQTWICRDSGGRPHGWTSSHVGPWLQGFEGTTRGTLSERALAGASPWRLRGAWTAAPREALPQRGPLFPATGQQIKRVKPKRTTSFFSRQLSTSQGSYTVVQPSDSLEQG